MSLFKYRDLHVEMSVCEINIVYHVLISWPCNWAFYQLKIFFFFNF